MKFIEIKITGNGKAQKVKLFDAINNPPDLPPVKVEIIYIADNSKSPILYKDFVSLLSRDLKMVKYSKIQTDAAASFSLHRIDKNGVEFKYLHGAIFPLDYSFFVIADFPHHGRRSWCKLTFEIL